MAGISGDLLRINGEKVSGLKTYDFESNLLWTDAERNMNGDVRATYLGEYPKLALEFHEGLTQDEVKTLYRQLSSPYFSVTYFHPGIGSNVTAQYYRSDYKLSLLDKRRGLYKSFTVNLIPISRRV